MPPLLVALASVWVAAGPAPHDVQSPAERRQSLLEYVAGRDDLDAPGRKSWDAALRAALGGKAVQDGSDEGVTAAKSVVSAAIFEGVDPVRGARAAREAYHDVYRFVPPPVAIAYQVLAFSGKKPAASPRQMAFDFPRHFDDDIAPELARWWDEALAAGRIPAPERGEVVRALAETRRAMRPRLRDLLWQGAELEARRTAATGDDARELDRAILELGRALRRDYAHVAGAPDAVDPAVPFYGRYAGLCAELGQKPRPRPAAAAAAREEMPGPSSGARGHGGGSSSSAAAGSSASATAASGSSATGRGSRIPADGGRSTSARVSPVPTASLVLAPAGWPRPLVAAVDHWLGTPYRWGGTGRGGVDCSAFVRAVYEESAALELPRNAGAQYLLGVPVPRSSLRPGDLVFFDTLDRGRVTHVAVYLGDGVIAHASSSRGVTRADLKLRYYQRAWVGARRLLGG